MAVLLISGLAACGGSSDKNNTTASRAEVSDINGLFAALETPGVDTIALKPGVYNISEWIENGFEEFGAKYGSDDLFPMHGLSYSKPLSEHVYQVFDEIFLYRVSNMTITSADPQDPAKLVIENVSDVVLNMYQCTNVTISGLVIGHAADPGACSGDVVYIGGSDYIYLTDCELYGCGAHALSAEDSQVFMDSCDIHNCTYGCAMIFDSVVDISGTAFHDCFGGIMFKLFGESQTFFSDCSFARLDGTLLALWYESDFEYQDSYARFTDCDFDEAAMQSLSEDILNYPERITVE